MDTTELSTASPVPVPEAESVRVVIQTRPLLPFEAAHNAAEAVSVQEHPPLITVERPRGAPADFTAFDSVYKAAVSSVPDALYDAHVAPLVTTLFTGINATVFAYGQTCAGKSYTMRHITNRVAADVFTHKRRIEAQGQTHIAVRVGFVEIYRESIQDLVDGASAPLGAVHVNLRTRANRAGSRAVFLDGAKDRCVDNEGSLLEIIREGALVRRTAATGMNASSSRSHSIITVSVVQEPIGDDDGTTSTSSSCLAAKLHLVDLAGSERAKRTAAGGDRFAEGVDINKGLFALAKVISTLADNSTKPPSRRAYVPYRESKLTRLLQDSLGGSARTLLVACVSPADSSAEETLGTLRYAERARCIKNKPKVNKDANAVEVSDLRAALSRARAEIAALVADNERLRVRAARPCTACACRSSTCVVTSSPGEEVSRRADVGESSDVTQSPQHVSPPRKSPVKRAPASPSPPRTIRTATSARSSPSRRNAAMRDDDSPPRRVLRAPLRASPVRSRVHDNLTTAVKTAGAPRGVPRRARSFRRDPPLDEDSRLQRSPTQSGLRRRTKSSFALRSADIRAPLRGNLAQNTTAHNTTNKQTLNSTSQAEVSKSLLPAPRRGDAAHAKRKRARIDDDDRTEIEADTRDSDMESDDSFDEDDDDNGTESNALGRNVANALTESRLEEMRRTFTERLEQAESDKSSLDAERLRLVRQVMTLEERHNKEIEELKSSHQARISIFRSKLADVKRLEAESTRLSKLRDGSDAARKRLQGKVQAAERSREEMVSRLTDMLSKTEVTKLNLGKENRELARSERQLRLELHRAVNGKAKLQSLVNRLRSENEAMRTRLRSSSRSSVRRTNSSFVPSSERRSATALRD